MFCSVSSLHIGFTLFIISEIGMHQSKHNILMYRPAIHHLNVFCPKMCFQSKGLILHFGCHCLLSIRAVLAETPLTSVYFWECQSACPHYPLWFPFFGLEEGTTACSKRQASDIPRGIECWLFFSQGNSWRQWLRSVVQEGINTFHWMHAFDFGFENNDRATLKQHFTLLINI